MDPQFTAIGIYRCALCFAQFEEPKPGEVMAWAGQPEDWPDEDQSRIHQCGHGRLGFGRLVGFREVGPSKRLDLD